MADDYGRNRERDQRPRGYDKPDRTDGNERAGPPHDRRNRSRSPRRERGGRRADNNRPYRSRSPPYRRGDRRDRRNDRDDRQGGREPPRGPRGGRGGHQDRKVEHSDMDTTGGPVRPPARGSPAAATLPPGKAKKEEEDSKDVKMEDLDSKRPPDVDDDTWEMMKVMGFGTFKTTKNTKVPGNDKNYGVRRDKTMEARQYMNRQGGFNRPLSPSRTGL